MRSKICGHTLNNWTLFIGFLYILQGLSSSIILIINIVKYKQEKSEALARDEPYDEDREVVSTLSVLLFLTLTFVLTTPFLLWGAYKEKHLYLLPWLYNSMICIVVNSMYLFVTVIKNTYELDKTKSEVTNFVLIALTMTFGLAIQIVFYRIVYKLYKELTSERALEYWENSSSLFLVYEQPTTNQRSSSIVKIGEKIINNIKCFK